MTILATRRGYRELGPWARPPRTVRAFGIEGTGSRGAGLSRAPPAAGHTVLTVMRPNRRAAALAKSRAGPSGMIRQLKTARQRREGAIPDGSGPGLPWPGCAASAHPGLRRQGQPDAAEPGRQPAGQGRDLPRRGRADGGRRENEGPCGTTHGRGQDPARDRAPHQAARHPEDVPPPVCAAGARRHQWTDMGASLPVRRGRHR